MKMPLEGEKTRWLAWVIWPGVEEMAVMIGWGVDTRQLRRRRDRCRSLCLDLPRRMARPFLGIVRPIELCKRRDTMRVMLKSAGAYVEILALAMEQHV